MALSQSSKTCMGTYGISSNPLAPDKCVQATHALRGDFGQDGCAVGRGG